MIERRLLILLLLLLVVGMLLAAGCTTPVERSVDSAKGASVPGERVEVYHFHMTQQCYSCKTVGAYAEETINTFFAPEVAAGRVVFAHVNVELPEHRELVEQYGATGSSLWIGVYDENGFHKEQNMKVWYKIGDKDEYMAYFKDVLEKRLAGDFS